MAKSLHATQFRKALLEVCSSLPIQSYALVGGLAVNSWTSSTRVTQDLDFALLTQDTKLLKEKFPQELGEDQRIYVTRIYDIEVDFLKPGGYCWNREAILKAKYCRIEGVSVPVVTPEYLVVYKMYALRSSVDEADIVHLLNLPGVYEKARRLVKKYLSAQDREDLDQLMKLTHFL